MYAAPQHTRSVTREERVNSTRIDVFRQSMPITFENNPFETKGN
jgi:hypothetical protein